MSYATLQQLKDYLKITVTKDDGLLQDMLDAASAAIEGATGHRVFAATATPTTKQYDWTAIRNGTLALRDDLASVSAITVEGVALDLADLRLRPFDGPYETIYAIDGWDVDQDSIIAVTGQWVYSLTPPEAIVHATRRLAAWMYRQKDSNADLDRPVVTGDGVTILPSRLPADVLSLIEPYRRLV